MSPTALSLSSYPMSLPFSIPSPLLTSRDAWLFDILCGIFVHLVYKRFEPQPVDFISTGTLLLAVPLIPSYHLVSHLQPQTTPQQLLLRIVASYFVFYLALLTSIMLYRVSPFHPLAKFPGPPLARLSQFWASWTVSSGRRHLYYRELHSRYGPYIRVGPNEISCIDTAAIPHVLGHDGLPKGPIWPAKHDPTGNTHILIALHDAQEHLRRRKAWNRAFSSMSVKDYERTLELRAVQLADELEKRAIKRTKDDCRGYNPGKAVDLSTWISYFAFDFMGDMAFGKSFNLMSHGDTEGVWHMLEGSIKAVSILQQTPYFRAVLWKIPASISTARKFTKFVKKLGTERLNARPVTKDALHYLIDEDCLESAPPSFRQVVADALLVVFAGSDTTSTVLGNIMFNLVAHPDVLSRLRDEVDSHFPPGVADEVIVDSTKFVEMSFLNAVINEGLRLRPALPVNLQRIASEGKWIGSCYLPAGTAINIPPYIVHRDERNFSPFPDRFWPDRWLPSHFRKPPSFLSKREFERFDVSNVTTNHSAFIPFSYGPQNCVGKNLAMLELRTVVTLLVRRFEMEFGDDGEGRYNPERWEQEGEDWFVFKNGRLPVVMTCRH